MMTGIVDPADGRGSGGRSKEDAVTRPADPVVRPIDLENYLDWRKELMEALAESGQDAREGRTRPAEALLAELKQDVRVVR